MENGSTTTVVLSIAAWYILTALSSISLKQALTSETVTPLWASVLVSVPPCLGFLTQTIRRPIHSSSNPTWVMILLGLIQGLYILTLFLSFSLEGVALTYTIKALEPMGNLCLLRLLGRPAHVTPLSFLSLCFLPYGIFLSQRRSDSWTLGRGLGCALFNVGLTSVRSVLLKLYTYNPTMSYFHISAFGLLFLIPAALLVGGDDFDLGGWITSSNLIFGVASFVGYNFASFFVLSNVDPVLHGACNVLKRSTTVALAMMMIPEEAASLPPHQLFGVGFTFVALGVYAYGRSRPSRKIRLARFAFIAMVMVSQIFLPISQTSYRNAMYRHIFGTHNFVVWTFPFAPPSVQYRSEYSEQYLGKDNVFVCSYRKACPGGGDDFSTRSSSSLFLNLPSLTSEDSLFHQYVADHAYHKVRHGLDFPLHIQAIAMISLLSKNPGTCNIIVHAPLDFRSQQYLHSPHTFLVVVPSGSCVRTWGAKTKYCDSSAFQDYDPYQLHFDLTNYPVEFLQSDGKKKHPGVDLVMDLAPDLSQHSFAMWGYDYGKPAFGEQSYPAGHFNSGEDVQSFASVTWYPFVSHVVDKRVALTNFDGHYIANALASSLETPSGSDIVVDRMKLVSLLSIYLGDFSNVQKNAAYISMYTKMVGEAFGARSKKTHRDLLSMRIKSYFSACLTLTINMLGAKLNNDTLQCNSIICYDLIFPRSPIAMASASENSTQADDKSLILMVDVVDEKAVPLVVRDKALKFSADIPRGYGGNLTHGYMERMDYAYRLLSMYGNRAKVVITSRIHVGLPAAALGVPVIFVEKGNWLPGGRQSVGRVEGLLDVFHRLDLPNGRDWTYGDLNGDIPPNPGNHLADRYRASFWNRLKRQSNFYADAAKLFGMVPLQRLGYKMTRDDIHSLFHFIWDGDKHLSWHARRAIEQIFYFHPNAKLYVHGASNDGMALHPSLVSFVESGYDLEYLIFHPKELADRTVKDGMVSYHSELLQKRNYPILVSWNYGGVFVSPGTHLTKELPLTLSPTAIFDSSDNVALLILSKRQPLGDIFNMLKNGNNSVEMIILSHNDTRSCMEDPRWVGIGGLNEGFGVVVDELVASNCTLLIESLCFQVLEENCIFCDEVHWEFEEDHGKETSPEQQHKGYSQLQDSHGTLMNRYPDEYSFVKNYIDNQQLGRGGDLRLLSYGSSIGFEAISLATLYFNNDTKYQNISIYGVDIDETTLEKARENVITAGSQIKRNITFFHGETTPISVHGKYYVIFANSVLCFHPRQLNQILKHFPFSKFEEALQSLDTVLEDGGLLAIVNTNYNFNETTLAKRYVSVAKCRDNSFVPRIDRDTNTFVQIEGQEVDCVWVKTGSDVA